MEECTCWICGENIPAGELAEDLDGNDTCADCLEFSNYYWQCDECGEYINHGMDECPNGCAMHYYDDDGDLMCSYCMQAKVNPANDEAFRHDLCDQCFKEINDKEVIGYRKGE